MFALGMLATAATAIASMMPVPVGPPELVNRNSAGEISSYSAYNPAISRTGRYALVETVAPNMHRPGVTYAGIYLRDRRTGRTTIPVRDARGRPPRRGAVIGSISPNGRYLSYCATDPRIVRPDSYDAYTVEPIGLHPDTDVFVRDLRTGETRRLSTNWKGKESDGASCWPQVADNGDTVFTSVASDLVRHDPDGVNQDAFLYDWSTRRLHRLGVFSTGYPVISGDGRYVVSWANGRLATVDHNIYDDLYVLHRHRDGGPGRYELLSQRAGGGGLDLNCDDGPLDISYDGRYVVGSCRDGELFDPPIPDKHSHLTLFDRKTGRHTLLNSTTSEHSYADAAAVSDDGRTVLFGSGSGTGFGGTTPEVGPDLYVWRRGVGITLVTVGNDSVYQWRGFRLDLTGDGRTAIFESDSSLVPGDNDRGNLDPDVYTVRIGS